MTTVIGICGIRLSGRPDELQHIEVASFSGPKFGRWGGANDGMARLPLRAVRLRWLAAAKPELKRFPVEVTNVKLQAKSAPPDPVRIETSDPAAHFVAPGTPSVTLTLDREPESARSTTCGPAATDAKPRQAKPPSGAGS